MNWPHAILTDSGGFQVMSLSQLRKIDEQGVTFRSHLDGATVELSPRAGGRDPGASWLDIAMQLDECRQAAGLPRRHRAGHAASLRWAEAQQARICGEGWLVRTAQGR
jgi:queuine tRNA-ribosyltransferase